MPMRTGSPGNSRRSPGLTRGELIGLWEKAHGRPPPKGLSRRLLEYSAAYRVQAKAFGGLKPMVRRKLRAGAASRKRTSKSTLREWNPIALVELSIHSLRRGCFASNRASGALTNPALFIPTFSGESTRLPRRPVSPTSKRCGDRFLKGSLYIELERGHREVPGAGSLPMGGTRRSDTHAPATEQCQIKSELIQSYPAVSR